MTAKLTGTARSHALAALTEWTGSCRAATPSSGA